MLQFHFVRTSTSAVAFTVPFCHLRFIFHQLSLSWVGCSVQLWPYMGIFIMIINDTFVTNA